MADKLLQDVYRKIEREKVLINGARAMRQSTDNSAVQQRLDNQIRESQRNLSYLEERYNELQNMVITSGVDGMTVGDGGAQDFLWTSRCNTHSFVKVKGATKGRRCYRQIGLLPRAKAPRRKASPTIQNLVGLVPRPM